MEKETCYVYNLKIMAVEKPSQEQLFEIIGGIQDQLMLHQIELEYLGQKECNEDD